LCSDQRSEAGLGVRVPGGGSARRDGVARDVARVARVGPFEFFWLGLKQFFSKFLN
jgi:hypothetical protein